jgi:lipopolysaccharide transport system permease protein
MERTGPSCSESISHYFNPRIFLSHLWQHRDIIYQFTKREIEGRYKGSFIGIFWSIVNPLVLLCTYTYVFGLIFRARWPGVRAGTVGEFATVLFCGITTFNIFSECVTRAAGLVVGVPNFVKKLVFPLEVLPLSLMGSALFHSLISLTILLVINFIVNGTIHWTVLLLPLVALPLVFLTLGLTWFLAGLGVFIRDISYTIALVVQVLFFVTPIFYSIDVVPAPFQGMIRLNPLTEIVENFRRVILWGKPASWPDLGIWLISTGTLMMLGYAWFMKTKRGFADVI